MIIAKILLSALLIGLASGMGTAWTLYEDGFKKYLCTAFKIVSGISICVFVGAMLAGIWLFLGVPLE